MDGLLENKILELVREIRDLAVINEKARELRDGWPPQSWKVEHDRPNYYDDVSFEVNVDMLLAEKEQELLLLVKDGI